MSISTVLGLGGVFIGEGNNQESRKVGKQEGGNVRRLDPVKYASHFTDQGLEVRGYTKLSMCLFANELLFVDLMMG